MRCDKKKAKAFVVGIFVGEEVFPSLMGSAVSESISVIDFKPVSKENTSEVAIISTPTTSNMDFNLDDDDF